jgi:AcrR family transcriptional regulator
MPSARAPAKKKSATQKKRKAAPKKKPASPGRRGRKKGAPPLDTDAILEGAGQVFIRQGYANTSLRQLMAGAGVSTTAFYARFASKEAVLEALATRFLTGLAAEGAARLAEVRSIEEGFEVGVDVLLKSIEAQRPLVRLLVGEAGAAEGVRRGLAAAYEQLAGLVEAQLERLVEKGAIEAADAKSIGWAFVGALKIQVERWALYEAIDGEELGPALHATARALMPVLRRRAR